jgi:hypothetical protein
MDLYLVQLHFTTGQKINLLNISTKLINYVKLSDKDNIHLQVK